MIIEYYLKPHIGGIKRKYVKDKIKRMWLMKLTKHATITGPDFMALTNLGITLREVKMPKEAEND